MPIMDIPKTVVIVPYRDRALHKAQFLHAMADNMAHLEGCHIYFAHQADTRSFNRGAMKNLGFLAIKMRYPEHYKDMTFVFHDVDCWHRDKGAIPYTTEPGVVSHYYGATYALGGMFAIKGADFERARGFPNFWGWGLEDNAMYDRCKAAGLVIRRDPFFLMRDKDIVRPFDGYQRVVAKREAVIYKHETPDDLFDLADCSWRFDKEMIHITNFTCSTRSDRQDYRTFDIRSGGKLQIPRGYFRRSWTMGSVIGR
jgi:hypothetical protein